MSLNVGDKAVVTTDCWFYAPDGLRYRAAYGTVKGVRSDAETLGIKTNARSTNWYVEIGNLTIAGCQIHYAVKCDEPPPDRVDDETEHDGKVMPVNRVSHIYNADVGSA